MSNNEKIIAAVIVVSVIAYLVIQNNKKTSSNNQLNQDQALNAANDINSITAMLLQQGTDSVGINQTVAVCSQMQPSELADLKNYMSIAFAGGQLDANLKSRFNLIWAKYPALQNIFE